MELPMKTIAVTVLALFVLAGVGIFFFSEASANNELVDNAQCVQICYGAAAQVAAGASPETAQQKFCENSCQEVMNCQITEDIALTC